MDPLCDKNGSADFTHVVLLKDVQALAKYYASAAQEKTIQSCNMLNALEELGSDHIRADLEQADTVSSNFTRDGVEYYYCATALRSCDTLLLFLIPAELYHQHKIQLLTASDQQAGRLWPQTPCLLGH